MGLIFINLLFSLEIKLALKKITHARFKRVFKNYYTDNYEKLKGEHV